MIMKDWDEVKVSCTKCASEVGSRSSGFRFSKNEVQRKSPVSMPVWRLHFKCRWYTVSHLSITCITQGLSLIHNISSTLSYRSLASSP